MPASLYIDISSCENIILDFILTFSEPICFFDFLLTKIKKSSIVILKKLCETTESLAHSLSPDITSGLLVNEKISQRFRVWISSPKTVLSCSKI